MWLAYGNRGIDRLDIATRQITHFRHDPQDPTSLPVDDIRSIDVGADGILWLTSEQHGLVRFDSARGQFTHYQNDPQDPESIPKSFGFRRVPLKDGRLLEVHITDSTGANFFNPATGKNEHQPTNPGHPFGVYAGAVHAAMEDRDGRLWRVNANGLAQVYDPLAVPFTLYKHEPGNKEGLGGHAPIRVVENSLGQIWIGLFGQGLDLLDPSTGKFKNFRHDPNDPQSIQHNYPASLFEDAQGNFYVSTPVGLSLFDKRTHKVIRRLTNNTLFFTIRQDVHDPDVLWGVGWAKGLCSYHRVTDAVNCFLHDRQNPDSLATDTVLRFIIDKDDPHIFWLPTWGGGLDRFDKRTGKFSHHVASRDAEETISTNTVYDVLEDRQGRMWVATANGFNRFDKKTGTFKRFMRRTGFPADVVHNVLEDDSGMLWLGSDAGLIRFDPGSEKVIRVYTTEDGVHSNEFFATANGKTRDGRLWFSGFKGLTVVDPAHLPANPHLPPVYLTSVRVDGAEIHPGSAFERVRSLVFN